MKARHFDNLPRPEAITRLYGVFARYPARADMPRCEHCISRDDIEYLCRTSIAELKDNDAFAFYHNHAISTVGAVVDFKHFLPRIFEVMYCGKGSVDEETTIARLTLGSWREWPPEEQGAIRDFFAQWWRHVLSIYPSPLSAEECLCAIAHAGEDISAPLEYWRLSSGPEPLRHLAALLDSSYGYLMEDDGCLGFWWTDLPRQGLQLRNWLLSPRTGDLLTKGFFAYSVGSFAKQLSDAVQQYEWATEAERKRGKDPGLR